MPERLTPMDLQRLKSTMITGLMPSELRALRHRAADYIEEINAAARDVCKNAYTSHREPPIIPVTDEVMKYLIVDLRVAVVGRQAKHVHTCVAELGRDDQRRRIGKDNSARPGVQCPG